MSVQFSQVFSLWHQNRRNLPDPYFRARQPQTPTARFVDADKITLQFLSENLHRSFFVCGNSDGLTVELRREAAKSGIQIEGDLAKQAITVTFPRPDLVMADRKDWCMLWPIGRLFERHPDVSADEALAAMMQVKSALRACTSDDTGRWIRPRATPAQTGIDILCTYMTGPTRFARLSSDEQKIIVTRIQGRTEIQPRRGSGTELHYLDHSRFYERIMAHEHFPTGEFVHTFTSAFADDYRPSWYRVTAAVPLDWKHVGLVPYNGQWPSKPGTIIEGWFPEPETRLMRDRGWLTAVHERLSTESATRCFRPFVTCMRSIEQACEGNAIAIGWCRSALLNAIGRLQLPAGTSGREREIPYDEFDQEATDRKGINYVFRRGVDGTLSAVVSGEHQRDSFIAPQVCAHIWACGRSRLTRALLDIPSANIIGCKLDAIYTTHKPDMAYFSDRGRTSPFVYKGYLAEPYRYPRSEADLELLSERAVRFIGEHQPHGT